MLMWALIWIPWQTTWHQCMHRHSNPSSCIFELFHIKATKHYKWHLLVLLKVYWAKRVPLSVRIGCNVNFAAIFPLFLLNPHTKEGNARKWNYFYFRKSRCQLKFIFVLVANCQILVTWAIFIAFGIFVWNVCVCVFFVPVSLCRIAQWIWQQIFAWLPFQVKFIFECHKVSYKKNFSICSSSFMYKM